MDLSLPIDAVPQSPARFYQAEDRTGAYSEVAIVGGPGEWTLDVTGLTGRFWPSVEYTLDAVQRILDMAPVDLPVDVSLVVTPETLARKAGIPLPLDDEDRQTIIEAIADAQADVMAYLGRNIVPTTIVETNRYGWDDGWVLERLGDETLIEVVSAEPEWDPAGQPTNYFTVTYVAGLDAANDPVLRPIRRYVTAHAMNSPEFTATWKALAKPEADVKSLSAEGQSVSFTSPTLGGGGQAGSGAPGALPTLASLDRWRLAGRRVHQGKTRAGQWPYTSMDRGAFP